jgi:two-component system, NarL family, nitrate/nitrite response regulator NarL
MFLDALAPLIVGAGIRLAEASSDWTALADSVRRNDPDVCLVSSGFLRGDPTGAVEAIKHSSPDCKVIVLATEADPDMLNDAIQAGVEGFVQKNRGVSVLLDVIDRVMRGEVVVEASFTRPGVLDHSRETVRARKLVGYLTRREHECLALLVEGLDTQSISNRLGISRTTVRSHIQSTLTKLGVHSRLEAVALAVQHQLLDPDRSGLRAIKPGATGASVRR